MKHLRTYNLSVTFYRETKNKQLTCHVRDQWQRASLSIVLNLAEGTGRRSPRDQCRFFTIAMGSIRECQAIVDICPDDFTTVEKDLLDHIAASTFKLIQTMERKHSPST